MSSITIHNLDAELDQLIRQKATEEGTSLNTTIKRLLHQALGLNKSKKNADYSQFVGVWSEDEYAEFHDAIKDVETIHPDEWR